MAKNKDLQPAEVMAQFQGYIKKLKAEYNIEEADQLAVRMDDEAKQKHGEVFYGTIHKIYETDKEFHWQLGFFYFFFDKCQMFKNINIKGKLRQYNSFNEFIIDNEDELGHSKTWIFKHHGIYEHYVWKLGIEPGHPLYQKLREVGNFDVLEIMKAVCRPETVEDWLNRASEKTLEGKTKYTKDEISSQIEVWKQRMRKQGITVSSTVKPITGLPKRTYRVTTHADGETPLKAKDFPDIFPVEVPGDSEVEITYRIKKWGYIPSEEDTNAET